MDYSLYSIEAQLRGIEAYVVSDKADEETLSKLAGRLKELGNATLALAQKVGQVSPFLPIVAIDNIVEYLDPKSLTEFVVTNSCHRDLVQNYRLKKYLWEKLFHRALEDALVREPDIRWLDHIVTGIYEIDPNKALELIERFLEEDRTQSPTINRLLSCIATLEPLKASDLAYGPNSYVVHSVTVQVLAQDSIERVLEFINKKDTETKAILLGVLCVAISKDNPVRAREFFNQALALGIRTETLQKLVLAIVSETELALIANNLIDTPDLRCDSEICISLAKKDPIRALAIAKELHVPVYCFAKIITEIEKVDLELGKRTMQELIEIVGANNRDNFRYLAPVVALYDFDRAIQLVNRIISDHIKWVVIRTICSIFGPTEPDKVCALAGSDRESLEYVVKGYFKKDISKAIEIVEKLVLEKDYVATDILIELAKINFSNALAIVKKIKSKERRVEAIVAVATQAENKSEAKKLVNDALDVLIRLKDASYCYQEVLKLLGKAWRKV